MGRRAAQDEFHGIDHAFGAAVEAVHIVAGGVPEGQFGAQALRVVEVERLPANHVIFHGRPVEQLDFLGAEKAFDDHVAILVKLAFVLGGEKGEGHGSKVVSGQWFVPGVGSLW